MASLRLPNRFILIVLLTLFIGSQTLWGAERPPLVPACKGKIGTLVGHCAPAFAAPEQLAPLRNKVLVVHFWATWCEPCRDELPLLHQLQLSLTTKTVAVVAVSLDTEASALSPYYKKQLNTEAPAFVSMLDAKQQISTLFGTFKVPETFIIGKDGRIKDKIVGSYKWDDPLVAHYLELLGR